MECLAVPVILLTCGSPRPWTQQTTMHSKLLRLCNAQGCSPKKFVLVGSRNLSLYILSKNLLFLSVKISYDLFFSHQPQIMLFVWTQNLQMTVVGRFTPNFLLFIPVNKYGLCYKCVIWVLRTKVLGRCVHPVEKGMWMPSTSFHVRLHPW